MISRIHPVNNKGKDAGGYLGRIVHVNDDVIEYREWVANVWSAYSIPLITQLVSPPVPTYASIANRHLQPGNLLKTQGMTSQDVSHKSATWPRSQSNVETLVLENRTMMQRDQQALVKHPSADCLYTLAGGGIEMKLSTNSVWTAPSVRKLADSLAQDNVTKKRVTSETKTANIEGSLKFSSNSKPTSTNSSGTSSSSEVISYSAVTKQSTASSKGNLATTTIMTHVVDSAAKTVSVSGPSSTKTSVNVSTTKSKAVSISGQASTKTTVIDLTSKSKTVSVSGPTSSGPHKKTEQKTLASNNNVSSNHFADIICLK